MGHYTPDILSHPVDIPNIVPLYEIPIRHSAPAHYSPVTFYTVFQKSNWNLCYFITSFL